MNKGEEAIPFRLWTDGRAAGVTSPPRSIVSLVVR